MISQEFLLSQDPTMMKNCFVTQKHKAIFAHCAFGINTKMMLIAFNLSLNH